VDAADYSVWRNGLYTTYTPDHYAHWKGNFGAAAGSASLLDAPHGIEIPEATSLVLALIGALAFSNRS